MTETPEIDSIAYEIADWLSKEPRPLIVDGDNVGGHVSSVTMLGLRNRIAAALTAERERARPPQGCVRLPDGRDVKVLGTLPLTKDGCVVGNHAELWIWDCEPIKLRADNIGATDVHGDDAFYEAGDCYSTRAAAEAARGGGGERNSCTR